ncbi:MAG: SUF system NifU family Fe-S cluster assembly protein [Deltaproteobacteria bacterium]|jgi:nitrogen fixation NifU-like protein|nr:SUF system NifU family Fe-S cluster assembly protein [Deltaproteobacteria bacterium]
MDLRELYQEVILDHGKNPRNHRFPEPYNREGRGYNPLCGDKITLRLQLDGETITDIGFIGQGCAISQASCSTMTEALKGKTVGDAEALFEKFHALVTGDGGSADEIEELGKLAVFAGVREFPMRVKCATLGWHTLNQALRDEEGVAKTE